MLASGIWCLKCRGLRVQNYEEEACNVEKAASGGYAERNKYVDSGVWYVVPKMSWV